MAKYTWEVQRQWHGLWSYQNLPSGHPDPRGYERSELSPDAFAYALSERLDLTGGWRIAVWDSPLVGAAPVAVLESTEVRRG